MVFKEDMGYPNTKTELPCGQCIGCRLERSRSWAARCVHEASLYDQNCFVTLTYMDSTVPKTKDGLLTLSKKDLQLFMKRLRKKHPDQTIRFFACGEYGDETLRPHYHMIIFNYYPPDALFFQRKKGFNYFLSTELAELWPHGQHAVGECNFDTAAYTARYVLKKIGGELAEQHYNGRTPEFCTMSRKPGLGLEWYNRFTSDLYNHDRCVVRDNLICRPPRYYDRLYDLQQPETMADLKRQRKHRAQENTNNTPERLEARERVAQVKQKRLVRNVQENH